MALFFNKKRLDQGLNFGSRVFDQINPFDDGRSFTTRTPTQKRSVGTQIRDVFDANTQSDRQRRVAEGRPADYRQSQQQAGQTAYTNPFESVARNTFVDPVVRGVNTLGSAGIELAKSVRDAGELAKVSVTGTDNQYTQKLREINERSRGRGFGRDGGILNLGTNFDKTEDLSDPKKFAGGVFQTGADVASVIPVGTAANVGFRAAQRGVRPVVKLATGGAAENTISSVGEQLKETGKVSPGQTALAAGAGAVLPIAGSVAGRSARGVINTARRTNTPTVKAKTPDAPTVRTPEAPQVRPKDAPTVESIVPDTPRLNETQVRLALAEAGFTPSQVNDIVRTTPTVGRDNGINLYDTNVIVKQSEALDTQIKEANDIQTNENKVAQADDTLSPEQAEIARLEAEDAVDGGNRAAEVVTAIRATDDGPSAMADDIVDDVESLAPNSARPEVKSNTAPIALIDELPKTIREKINTGTPLTAKEVTKVNEVRNKLQYGRNIDPSQLELGIDVQTKQQMFGSFAPTATKTTKAGNQVELAKGFQAISKEAGDIIKQAAERKPTAVSRVIGKTLPGQSSKTFRAFVPVLDSIKKKSPEFGKVIEDAIYEPLQDFTAYAGRVKTSVINDLSAVKKQNKLSKNDRAVLVEVLDGKGDTSQAKNPVAVQNTAEAFRDKYDQMLDELNRQELLAGKDLTPRRNDYFPHIRELLGEEKFLQPAVQADPDFIRRVGESFKFGKARTGDMQDIIRDPYEVMDIYSTAIEGQLRSLVPSRNIGLMIDAVQEVATLDKRGQRELSNWFTAINRDITGANADLNVLSKMQGRIAAGTVLGNVSSTLNNFIQPTLQAGVAPINSLKGLTSSFMSSVRVMQTGNIDDFLKVGGMESRYMRNTYSQIRLKKLKGKNVLERGGDVASSIFSTTDMISKKQVIETFFAKRSGPGVEPREALRLAEADAEMWLPSRTPGTLATAFRESNTGRVAFLFQTEVAAQAESIAASLRPGSRYSKNIGTSATNIVGLALAGHLFNKAFEQAFPGRSVAPDPIAWAQNAMAENEELEDGDKVVAATLDFAKQGLGQVPVIGSYFNEFSGRSPFQFPVLEIGGDIVESAKDVATGATDQESLLRLGRQASALVGRGTKPLFRAAEGTYEFFSGDDSKGFDSEQTPANLIRSIIGGAYNTREAQEFFENIENRNKLINSFDQQTQEDYRNIVGRGAELDGEYTRYKSVIDEGVTFERLFQNPNLVDMFTALAEFDKKQGNPVDPVYNTEFYKKNNLDIDEAQKTAFRYLAARSQEDEVEQDAIKELNPWLEKLDDARGEFFDKVTGTGKDVPEVSYGPNVKKPEYTDAIGSKLNNYFELDEFEDKEAYMLENPDLAEYFDKNSQYTRAKLDYLGKPQFDEYPEGSPEQQALNETYYSLPKGDGPRGGNKTRSEFLKANPSLLALWTARSVWTVQQEGARGAYEGIDLSQKGIKSVARMASNLLKMPDGSYVFDPNTYNRIAEAGGSGSGSGGRRKVAFRSPYEFKVSQASGSGQVYRPKVSAVSKPTRNKIKDRRTKVGSAPKTSIKKSKV